MTKANPAYSSADVRSLFAGPVAAAELRQPGDVDLLLPAEAQCLGRAVAQRRQEFAAGRLCARRALAEFGVVDFALRAAADRQPVWPAGFIGSITHTAGFCAAAVGERRHFLGLGLDCETIGEVTQPLWPRIFGPEEAAWVDSQPALGRAAAATMIFAAKEAFYKCQYPVVGERLDFHDVRIEPLDWRSARGFFAIHGSRHLAIVALTQPPMLGTYRIVAAIVAVGVTLKPR